MNRDEEMRRMLEEADRIPESLNMGRIVKKTKRRKRVHDIGIGFRNLAIFAVLFTAVLATGVNTSKAFAEAVENIPVIGAIAKKLDFQDREEIKNILEKDKGLESVIDNYYVEKYGEVKKGKNSGLAVTMEYAIADDNNLSLLWRIDGKEGMVYTFTDTYLTDMDTNKTIDVNYASGDFAKAGALEMYRIYWEGYHENVSLTVRLGSYDGESEEMMYLDYYTFSLKGMKRMEPKVIRPGITFDVDGMSYSVSEIRMFPTLTEIDIAAEDAFDIRGGSIQLVLSDEKGNQSQEMGFGLVESGGFGNGKTTKELTSGYFTMEGNLNLQINEVTYELADSERMRMNRFTGEIVYRGETISGYAFEKDNRDFEVFLNDGEYAVAIPGSYAEQVNAVLFEAGGYCSFEDLSIKPVTVDGVKYSVIIMPSWYHCDSDLEMVEFGKVRTGQCAINSEYKVDTTKTVDYVPGKREEITVHSPSVSEVNFDAGISKWMYVDKPNRKVESEEYAITIKELQLTSRRADIGISVESKNGSTVENAFVGIRIVDGYGNCASCQTAFMEEVDGIKWGIVAREDDSVLYWEKGYTLYIDFIQVETEDGLSFSETVDKVLEVPFR